MPPNKRKQPDNKQNSRGGGDPIPDRVTAKDVEGAISCRFIAQALINLPVQRDFPGYGSFTGKVTGWDAKEDHGGAILHEVTFSDDDIGEYPYSEIIKYHENYLQTHMTQPVFQLQMPNLSSSAQAHSQSHQETRSPNDSPNPSATPASTTSPLPLP